MTGTITEVRLGDWVAIRHGQASSFRLSLRNDTKYEDEHLNALVDPSTIEAGLRVTVWYRSVGERRLVVDRLRVSEKSRLP